MEFVPLIVVLIIVAAGLRRVPVGEAWVFRCFKRIRTVEGGWHWVWPLIERRQRCISLLGRSVEVAFDGLRTQDDVEVQVRGRINFQVLDADKAAEEQPQLDRAAQDLTQSAVREMLGELTRESLSSRSRAEINQWLNGLLNRSASSWGVRIIRTQLRFSLTAPNADGSAS